MAGQAPTGGMGGALALPPGRPLLGTLAPGTIASVLHRPVNGGRIWTSAVYRACGPGWRNVAYVSGTTGSLIHGNLGAVTAWKADEYHQRRG